MVIIHLGRRESFCKVVKEVLILLGILCANVFAGSRNLRMASFEDLLTTNSSCTSPDCNGEMFLRGAANKPGGAIL